jgi:pyruvate,water dikinase
MVQEYAGASLAATPKQLVAMFADLQKAFLAASLPVEVEVEIQAWLECSQSRLFAVRSSATNEDSSEASFAGQYDSYLNVESNAIGPHVARCFASLFNPRAALYRRRKGFTSLGAMAVIVQEMAASDHAGVVFTQAPRRSDHLLIECAPGLADRVVSGSISPNRYFVDRRTLTITESVEPHVYDWTSVALIAAEALAIESDLGGPLDIEFGIQAGGIHVLQARPIPTSVSVAL